MGTVEGSSGAEAACSIQDKADNARNREGAAVGTHLDPVGDVRAEAVSGKDADSTEVGKVGDGARDAAVVGALLFLVWRPVAVLRLLLELQAPVLTQG